MNTQKFLEHVKSLSDMQIEKGTLIIYNCSSVIGVCFIDDADLDFIEQEGCSLEKIGNVFEESKEELSKKYINTCQSYGIFFDHEENKKKEIIKMIEEYTEKNKK
jgi:hypothetical protein